MNSLEIANKLNLIHEGKPFYIKDVFFDSREPIKDALFVAIKGEKTDGHLYIKELLDKDIAGFLVRGDFDCKDILAKGKSCLKAKDTIKALQGIASLKRENLKGVVVAVAGSAGKTTTKELIAHVLPGKVHKTYKNFNSQIGLPKVVITAGDYIDYLVLEMGATALEDIKKLTHIAKQHIGVISSIGEEHLESFGSIENVVKGNFEVFDSPNLLSGIYPKAFHGFYKKDYGLSFCRFRDDADIRVKNVYIDEEGTHFEIMDINFTIPVLSIGIAESAGAAVGVLLSLGIDWKELKDRFESFRGVQGRMQLVKKGFLKIVDDTYNANPVSVKNAILTLDSFKAFNKIIVLGDMLEMGAYSKALHEKVGAMLKASHIDTIYLYGKDMKYAYNVLRFSNKTVFYFENQEELSSYLIKSLKQKTDNTMVLVKGSRGMYMENIVRELINRL
ncbi:UDP-N-acetylmuramoyl-tripeptide--D-alanyl-D-alanine ligase [Hydrogenobaculum acidophilum]